MEYAALNNGVEMPMAGIGTFLLTPDEAEASVLSALRDGYRLIDTANAYVNERAVGRAMKSPAWPARKSFWRLRFGPRSMSSQMRLKRRWNAWIPTISICFSSISLQEIMWQVIV